ncbi:unnamed protein product [Scytosiphon promiscuus]
MKFLHALRREVFALHARAPQNLHAPAPFPSSAAEQRGSASLVRHGQGCGAGCGCVCDVRVSVDRDGTVTDASFAAKRMAMGVDGEPLRSLAGNLLLHECPCDTLRSLGSIATSECRGESLDSLRNRLLFSPAAPPSFVRNLVRKLDVPRSAAACAQVVEAALTTALTDRPYSRPLAAYAGNGGQVMAGAGGGAAAEGPVTGPYGGGGGKRGDVAGDGLVDAEDEADDLAEVDFRDQYDDFA